jgi:hypothetical protein
VSGYRAFVFKTTAFAALLILLVSLGGASSSAGDAKARPTASPPRMQFDLRALGEETKGRARSVGWVQLQQNLRAKERAVVKARLNDICPADGFGAYLEVRAYYPSESDSAYSYKTAQDARGCRADAKRVVLRTGWVSSPYRVTVRLREFDQEAGDIAFGDADVVEYTPQELSG